MGVKGSAILVGIFSTINVLALVTAVIAGATKGMIEFNNSNKLCIVIVVILQYSRNFTAVILIQNGSCDLSLTDCI